MTRVAICSGIASEQWAVSAAFLDAGGVPLLVAVQMIGFVAIFTVCSAWWYWNRRPEYAVMRLGILVALALMCAIKMVIIAHNLTVLP